MTIGIISRRPRSIHKERIILENVENTEKFPVGPISPSTGPMLLIQLSAAVKFVSKLKPSIDITSAVVTISVI